MEGRVVLVRTLLSDSNEDDEMIKVFNEAYQPFFQLFLDSNPNNSAESLDSFNHKYGASVDLKDYNEWYGGMLEAFEKYQDAQPIDEISLEEFYTQPLPGAEPMTWSEMDLRMALGVTITLKYSPKRSVSQKLHEEDVSDFAPPKSQKLESPKPETLRVAKVETNIKESDEVIVVKSSEESVEQASNWWLWLIGALFVFVALVVVVRRMS